MNRVRVTKIAVKKEARIPITSVTANPRTGPVPNWKRMIAVISVVRLASTIAESAASKPVSTAVRGVFPASTSSRMRSKMRTLASTATTVAIFLPVLFLQDVEGQLFSDLALTIAIAVCASLAVALTVVPSLAAQFAKVRFKSGIKRIPGIDLMDRAVLRGRSVYRSVGPGMVKLRWVIVLAGFASLGGAWALTRADRRLLTRRP